MFNSITGTARTITSTAPSLTNPVSALRSMSKRDSTLLHQRTASSAFNKKRSSTVLTPPPLRPLSSSSSSATESFSTSPLSLSSPPSPPRAVLSPGTRRRKGPPPEHLMWILGLPTINPMRLKAPELIESVLQEQKHNPFLNPMTDNKYFKEYTWECVRDAEKRALAANYAHLKKNKKNTSSSGSGSIGSDATAHLPQAEGKQQQKQQQQQQLCCTKCGRFSHSASECFAASTIACDVCHRCNLPGHHVTNCHLKSEWANSEQLPNNSGTYVLTSLSGARYVGTSTDIRRRVEQHRTGASTAAKYTKTLTKIRRVVPLPLFRKVYPPKCFLNNVHHSHQEMLLQRDAPPVIARGAVEKIPFVPTESISATSAASTPPHPSFLGATANPAISPHLYDEETRQFLAQVRAYGHAKVRGAAFCKAAHTSLDLYKATIMLKKEAAWLMGEVDRWVQIKAKRKWK